MSDKNNLSVDGNAFGTEVWDSLAQNSIKTDDGKPVTCLGMEFPNDDARREYFREELRKKLPELRQIEGFPIGKDEDIIKLSDPPYYTACPNPWLNDFIAEWEEEKKQLEREGKRKTDFEVKEPYASDVSEGKNNPIYMAHAYHTKCPHPAIMRYILHYTQPGDIVFDGFAGTGMTGVAANLCGSKKDVDALKEKNVKVGVRHGICSDLSPIATLIAASYNLKFNAKEFKRKAHAILEQVEQELGWMFETEIDGKKAKVNCTIWSDVYVCPSCGNEIVLWDESVDLKNKIIKDSFACPSCGFECTKKNMEKAWESIYDSIINKVIKINKKTPVSINYTLSKRKEVHASNYDKSFINSIDYEHGKKYVTKELTDGFNTSQPIRSNGFTHTHHFFTKRTFIYLSRLFELAGDDVFLRTWLTSVCQSTSKMNKFRFTGTGITTGTLYIPSINREFNPYNTLSSKIDKFAQIAYNQRGNSVMSLLSATNLQELNDNSIDYMFVDPPFGANIMYSELSSIWEGWLKVATNNQTEAIVNEYQHKTLFEYQQLMNRSFREFYRILKPGKWLTMEFSNTSAAVWNSIQNALQGVGFVVANVAALDKKQGSFKAVTTTTAVKQDLVITCYKPSNELTDKFLQTGSAKENVWDFIDEHLLHLPVHIEKGNATTSVVERSPKILYDRLISYYVQKGFAIPMDAQEFQRGLHERYAERDGMFFTATQVVEYEEKKLKAPEFVPMGIIVSDEANGIQWLKNFLHDGGKTYQEILPEWMQAINGLRKNDILPELKQILEENFIEESNGKWRLPNIQDDKDVNALRTKALLKEFKIYVDVAQKPKAKIKEARMEALRAGFKQCYVDKDFQTIVTVGNKIPQNLLTEDEVLLQFYDIAQSKL
ncbi:site-specific DNA-methyltransferase [Segatella bryantii]|uniref:DNA methyltransferase n=1 Tax=Segatella bryantii TaxID=77095 RepID=UPI001EDB926F|nr:DNA methyltransferase [Segatella bryantii]UKK72001.1 site-specific DNA-methyltransferase [Segatella bryantii]